MLKHNKTIAIVMAFVFCMSFLAPAFIAPDVAQAAYTATVAESNNVPASTTPQNLGYFKVTVDVADWTSAGIVYSQLLVSYPTRLATNGVVGSGATFSNAQAMVAAAMSANPALADSGIRVVVPSGSDNAFELNDIEVIGQGAQNGSVFIRLTPNNLGNQQKEGYFYVHLSNIVTNNFAGDVQVNLVPQSGKAFGTGPVPLVVGKVNVSGSTTATAKSVEKINSAGGIIDLVTIFENMKGTINDNGKITLEIVTKGYEWDTTNASARGIFNFLGQAYPVTNNGAAEAYIMIGQALAPSPFAGIDGTPDGDSGAITIGGLRINVDEKVAKVGQDIEVNVSGANITSQTIVVGQYVDFIANVVEDTTTELTAGLDEQTIGTFFIEEVAPGTLIEDRTILLELPAGVEWDTESIQTSNYELANNSAMTFSPGTLLDDRTLKFTVENGSQNAQNGAKVKFKKLKVDVSPSFTGDVVITAKGKAGVEGTAKVATVSPMITMTASAVEVNLGIKEQKVSDVEIVETKADTIVQRVYGSDQDMAFYLDAGFRFAKVPKVEVIEGDMVLEVNDVKIQAPASGQNLLIIPIRAASYKTPAKIKISDIYVTADRSAPTGDVVLYAADTASYSNLPGLTNSFNNTRRTSFQYDTPASVAIAKNVTVPPVETTGGSGSGTFVIGSNIYTVNGLTKVMDVAPYIKNSRTFVPYRYLALALGVADNDIVWDATAQTVTVTKGENKIVATIGSNSLNVNGSAVTMDVAPEIVNGRTMLPARYLAEALGANVGWDPATSTVVFEM